jgi:hypothetical protein
MPNSVAVLTGWEQHWKYRVPSGSNTWIQIAEPTDASIYVTYGEPWGSCVTKKRVEWVCQKASGQFLEPNCVNAVYFGVKNEAAFMLGARPWPDPPWLALGGVPGECWNLRDLFVLACEMLGLTCGIEKGFIYPNLNHGDHHQNMQTAGRWNANEFMEGSRSSITDHTRTVHNEYNVLESLMFYCGGYNYYEAAARYAGNYYCIPGDIFPSPTDAMLALVTKTYWTYKTDNSGGFAVCDDPGPCPEHDWKDSNHPYP